MEIYNRTLNGTKDIIRAKHFNTMLQGASIRLM